MHTCVKQYKFKGKINEKLLSVETSTMSEILFVPGEIYSESRMLGAVSVFSLIH